MKRIFCGLMFLLLSFSVAGCGYSPRSSMPSSLRTIYITDFKNKIDFSEGSARNTYLPLLEVKVRNAIINRYQFDGALRIAPKEKANLILAGDLVNYSRDPLRYQDNNVDVLEYRVHISVDLKLTDTARKESLWNESGFSGDATYVVSGPTASSEAAAVEKATDDLARRVVERTVENW